MSTIQCEMANFQYTRLHPVTLASQPALQTILLELPDLVGDWLNAVSLRCSWWLDLQQRSAEKSTDARAQLAGARALHKKLMAARATVQALQAALEECRAQVWGSALTTWRPCELLVKLKDLWRCLLLMSCMSGIAVDSIIECE